MRPLRLANRGRLVALALGAGLLVLFVGTSVESAAIATFRPSGFELKWVGDVVAAIAIAAGTYMSLRLSAARGQVRLAAEIQRQLALRRPLPR
jgi:hypothetical protein